MEIPTPDHITAEVLRLTDELTIDLIVHPSDVERVTESAKGRARQFRVIASEHVMPGKMICVDKTAPLLRRHVVDRGAQSSEESHL
jgi:hypothetical protein